MRSMFAAGIASAALLCMTTAASADDITNTVHITFNQSCNAIFNDVVTDNETHAVVSRMQSPLACALQADPGPGGLNSALSYDLGDPPSVTAGDLIVDDMQGNLVDLIRFNSTETITGIHGNTNTGVLVYYRAPGWSLADTGFPTSDYTNIVTVQEGPQGNYAYTPTVGQPGYTAPVDGPNGAVDFAITYGIGDTPAAPEPASALLLLGAIGVLAAGKRFKTTRS